MGVQWEEPTERSTSNSDTTIENEHKEEPPKAYEESRLKYSVPKGERTVDYDLEPHERTKKGGDGLRNNERGQAEGSLDQRQGDLAKTGDVDKNGHPFIPSSDGTTVFGKTTEDSGLTAAPIKLSKGFNETDEKGNNIGYGLLHIEARHSEQILEAGYSSVQEFVKMYAETTKKSALERAGKTAAHICCLNFMTKSTSGRYM